MNKAKLSWNKHSLATILSLGFIVLGIGCIAWAIFSIWEQSNYPNDDPGVPYSIPVTSTVVLKSVTEEVPAIVKSDQSIPQPKQEKALYSEYPKEGDSIGSLTIPSLKLKLPIVQGTDSDELKKGVGHFVQSVLPGENDNCVLSGHRETVFARLGELKIDDQLIVQTSAGKFTYEIKGTRIVDKDDKTVIVPTDHAVLTLTTCYPFRFIGNAPDRYIITADLLKNE